MLDRTSSVESLGLLRFEDWRLSFENGFAREANYKPRENSHVIAALREGKQCIDLGMPSGGTPQ